MSAETAFNDGDDVIRQRDAFPRSRLLQLIGRHPVAITAAVAAVVVVGPGTLGRWGLVGLRSASRHAPALAPLVGQLARTGLRRRR